MPLSLENLDASTRRYMIEEIDMDRAEGHLYISSRLNQAGRDRYPDLLREAAERHDDAWLAQRLRAEDLFSTHESRRTPSGGTTSAKVPVTAPETLAEGEFNRFYARGLCRRAVSETVQEVEVYRAKQVSQPRPSSEAMIGSRLDPNALLNDLRSAQGVEPALGMPPGPNSGLSIRLPK